MAVDIEKRGCGKAIYQLIMEATEAAEQSRRVEVRCPFFRPVYIESDGRRFSAFSRDLSHSGVGLQHNFELPLGEAIIAIHSEQGYSVRVKARIVWCRPCGEGWFVSGGEFLSPATIGE